MRHIARDLRRQPTRSEATLWAQLRDRRFLGLKFRRQHAIGVLILDFYCPALQLAIEVDGGIHDTLEGKTNDAGRDEMLNGERGIWTLRVRAEDCESDMDSVLAYLARSIAREHPISPSPSKIERGPGGEVPL